MVQLYSLGFQTRNGWDFLNDTFSVGFEGFVLSCPSNGHRCDWVTRHACIRNTQQPPVLGNAKMDT